MFRSLSEQERQELWGIGETIMFDPEETIAHEGELSATFFIVLDGTVKVHVDQQGRDVFVCNLGLGCTFGEASLFLKMQRTANVTAIDPVVVFKLTRNDLFGFIKKHPDAGNRVLLVIIHGLLKKLRDANQELAYERREDSDQEDIDALIAEMTK